MATKTYSFRIPEEVNAHLGVLCEVTGETRTSLIISMIECEYDKYQGNPELRKLLGQMMDMKKQMEVMLGRNDTPSIAPSSPVVPELGSCLECVNPCKDEIDPSEVGLCDGFKAEK